MLSLETAQGAANTDAVGSFSSLPRVGALQTRRFSSTSRTYTVLAALFSLMAVAFLISGCVWHLKLHRDLPLRNQTRRLAAGSTDPCDPVGTGHSQAQENFRSALDIPPYNIQIAALTIPEGDAMSLTLEETKLIGTAKQMLASLGSSVASIEERMREVEESIKRLSAQLNATSYASTFELKHEQQQTKDFIEEMRVASQQLRAEYEEKLQLLRASSWSTQQEGAALLLRVKCKQDNRNLPVGAARALAAKNVVFAAGVPIDEAPLPSDVVLVRKLLQEALAGAMLSSVGLETHGSPSGESILRGQACLEELDNFESALPFFGLGERVPAVQAAKKRQQSALERASALLSSGYMTQGGERTPLQSRRSRHSSSASLRHSGTVGSPDGPKPMQHPGYGSLPHRQPWGRRGSLKYPHGYPDSSFTPPGSPQITVRLPSRSASLPRRFPGPLHQPHSPKAPARQRTPASPLSLPRPRGPAMGPRAPHPPAAFQPREWQAPPEPSPKQIPTPSTGDDSVFDSPTSPPPLPELLYPPTTADIQSEDDPSTSGTEQSSSSVDSASFPTDDPGQSHPPPTSDGSPEGVSPQDTLLDELKSDPQPSGGDPTTPPSTSKVEDASVSTEEGAASAGDDPSSDQKESHPPSPEDSDPSSDQKESHPPPSQDSQQPSGDSSPPPGQPSPPPGGKPTPPGEDPPPPERPSSSKEEPLAAEDTDAEQKLQDVSERMNSFAVAAEPLASAAKEERFLLVVAEGTLKEGLMLLEETEQLVSPPIGGDMTPTQEKVAQQREQCQTLCMSLHETLAPTWTANARSKQRILGVGVQNLKGRRRRKHDKPPGSDFVDLLERISSGVKEARGLVEELSTFNAPPVSSPHISDLINGVAASAAAAEAEVAEAVGFCASAWREALARGTGDSGAESGGKESAGAVSQPVGEGPSSGDLSAEDLLSGAESAASRLRAVGGNTEEVDKLEEDIRKRRSLSTKS
ncbi:hypothetical protein, conserved [Eimeria praecox]|uniref:Transmembrane protein n=1 Tax=Eimeria praecox TaxID=51316 RepID=U6H3M9_9EIME|nr:hypothetical protein, conserved [Eimeria praecox]